MSEAKSSLICPGNISSPYLDPNFFSHIESLMMWNDYSFIQCTYNNFTLRSCRSFLFIYGLVLILHLTIFTSYIRVLTFSSCLVNYCLIFCPLIMMVQKLILQENVYFYDNQSLEGLGLQSKHFLVIKLMHVNKDPVTPLEHNHIFINEKHVKIKTFKI